MSIADRLSKIMERPSDQNQDKDDVPFWLKHGARIVGTVGGFFAILFGIMGFLNIIVFDMKGFIAALWQAFAGFVVLISEAPCCCMFIDFVQNISDWIDRRPKWHKAAAFLLIPIPIFMLSSFSVSTFLACGLIFASGIMYGMMAVGKKASIDEMAQSATQEAARTTNIRQDLKSKLIQNAVTMSFTGVPNTDSHV